MSSPADPQHFWLQNPVARSFLISCSICRFNDPRDYPFAPTKLQKHEGIDLAGTDEAGQPVAVLAAQRGVVDKIGYSAKGYGHYVRVLHRWHNGTYVTWYAHLSQVLVREKEFVNAGDQLGIAGNTGNAWGKPHLHLTLQHLGHGLDKYVVSDVIDPEPFFKLENPPAMHELTFVQDVTVEDGTRLQGGQVFTKTWRVRNTGNTTWDSTFQLVHVQGHRLGAPSRIPLPTAAPGQLVDVSVTFTAPDLEGSYRSTWQAADGQGRLFNNPVFTAIEVVGSVKFNQASWVADVTVAGGTVIPAGESFLKTWRLRNSGNLPWTSGYRLAHISDESLGGPKTVPLPAAAPGEAVDVSVSLIAPDKPGTYRSTWQPVTPAGETFDFAQVVEIEVPVAITTGGTSEARFVADVTIPDGTAVQAGQTFTKTWRIRNSGTTTWGPGFEMAFWEEDPMGAGEAVPLPAAAPGKTVDVSVELTAPPKPGRYQSIWKPRDAEGVFFEFAMVADIQVAVPIPATEELDEARFEADVTIPDGTALPAGQPFTKTWRLRNSGTTTWGPGYELAFAGEAQLGGPAAVPLPAATPGQVVEVSVPLVVPTTPGTYHSIWQPRNPAGQFFDFAMYTEIVVLPAPQAEVVEDATLFAEEAAQHPVKVAAGSLVTHRLRVRNDGSQPWGPGYTLALRPETMDSAEKVTSTAASVAATVTGPESVPLPPAEPQQTKNVHLTFTAPGVPGRYETTVQPRNPAGRHFGRPVKLVFEVGATGTIDLLPYLRGDGRVYAMAYTWDGGGEFPMQTQHEKSGPLERFYIVKGTAWEEWWADERTIYRGTNTSAGVDTLYTLSEKGRAGCAWVPRVMSVDSVHPCRPLVTFRRKDNCQVINTFISETWVRLKAVHHTLTLSSGVVLKDAVELAVYADNQGQPAAVPFEKFIFAREYGLAAWEGERGQISLVAEVSPGRQPDLVREEIPCLPS